MYFEVLFGCGTIVFYLLEYSLFFSGKYSLFFGNSWPFGTKCYVAIGPLDYDVKSLHTDINLVDTTASPTNSTAYTALMATLFIV